jgi:hypothetical protein
LQGPEPVSDPFDRRRLEDSARVGLEGGDLLAEASDSVLGTLQCLAEGRRSLAVADEVDEVGDPPLLGVESGALELDLVR